jgi:hypothetical protein
MGAAVSSTRTTNAALLLVLAVLALAGAGFVAGGLPAQQPAAPPGVAVALGATTPPDFRVTYTSLDIAAAPWLDGTVSLGWDSPTPVRTSVYVGLPASYRIHTATFGALGAAWTDLLDRAVISGEDGIASQAVTLPVDVPGGKFVITVGFSFPEEAFRTPAGGFRDRHRIALQRDRGDLGTLVPASLPVTGRADGFSVMAISLSSGKMIAERVPNPTDLAPTRTRWRGPLLDVADPAAPFTVAATTSDTYARFFLQAGTCLLVLGLAAGLAYAVTRRRSVRAEVRAGAD